MLSNGIFDEAYEEKSFISLDELANIETKAGRRRPHVGLRRVRSAEGARRFGVPIGSVILADLPGARAGMGPIGYLKPGASTDLRRDADERVASASRDVSHRPDLKRPRKRLASAEELRDDIRERQERAKEIRNNVGNRRVSDEDYEGGGPMPKRRQSPVERHVRYTEDLAGGAPMPKRTRRAPAKSTRRAPAKRHYTYDLQNGTMGDSTKRAFAEGIADASSDKAGRDTHIKRILAMSNKEIYENYSIGEIAKVLGIPTPKMLPENQRNSPEKRSDDAVRAMREARQRTHASLPETQRGIAGQRTREADEKFARESREIDAIETERRDRHRERLASNAARKENRKAQADERQAELTKANARRGYHNDGRKMTDKERALYDNQGNLRGSREAELHRIAEGKPATRGWTIGAAMERQQRSTKRY